MNPATTIEKKKDEFRVYLERTGVVDQLTRVLVSLYEENEKPENALEFIKKNLNGPDESDTENLKLELKTLKEDYDKLKKKHDDLSKELEHFGGK